MHTTAARHTGCCVHGIQLLSTQGAVYMAAARSEFKRAMVGTKRANSRPGCTNRLLSPFWGFHFWQGRWLGL